MKGRTKLMIMSIAAIIAVLSTLSIAQIQNTPNSVSEEPPMNTFPVSTPVGIWSWESPTSLSAETAAATAKQLKQEGISNVYVDISGYADAMELPAHKNPKQAIAAFTAKLKEHTRAYSAEGIASYALAGNTAWGSADTMYLPLAIVDYVKDYNLQAKPDEKLHGIQFDIEPYSQKGFFDDATYGFQDYLTMTKNVIKRHAQHFDATSGISLGFAVPFWFDGENPQVPKVAFAGATKYPVFHLIDQLKTLPQGYIAVMAYRTQTGGEDGSIQHAKDEMEYASATDTVKVYIGQETAKVEPAQITFYALGKDKLKGAMKELEDAFKTHKAYGGLLVHDSESFRKLQ